MYLVLLNFSVNAQQVKNKYNSMNLGLWKKKKGSIDNIPTNKLNLVALSLCGLTQNHVKVLVRPISAISAFSRKLKRDNLQRCDLEVHASCILIK